MGIKSLYGNAAKVVNPWGTQQVRVRRTSDNAIVTTASASEISFATAANTVYVVERTAKPLSAYTATRLTGIAYLSERNGDMGNVDVYLDNVLQTNVNLYVSGPRQAQQVVFSKSGLSSGQHTIRIVNKTTAVGMVDALRVTTGGPPPTGTVISLRARANGQYVSAGNGTPLIANRTSVGVGEQFERVDLGGGNIALRAKVNDQLVAAEGGGAQPLIANRTAIGLWESFDLIAS